MADQSKQCAICKQSFEPHPCVAKRQYVCASISCQRERKRRSQQKWVKQNPGYFDGRYDNTKAWLADHPGYLKEYRRQRRNRCGDIQDELTPEKIMSAIGLRDIQDELTSSVAQQLSKIDLCESGDIQDELILYISIVLSVLIYKSRLRS